MTFNDWARQIHQWARSKGFYNRETLVVRDRVLGDVEGRIVNPSLPSEKLLLIVSECAEAQSAMRDGDFEHESEEVIDILIRVLDYAHWRGINIDKWITLKMEANEKRTYMHGRQF